MRRSQHVEKLPFDCPACGEVFTAHEVPDEDGTVGIEYEGGTSPLRSCPCGVDGCEKCVVKCESCGGLVCQACRRELDGETLCSRCLEIEEAKCKTAA